MSFDLISSLNESAAEQAEIDALYEELLNVVDIEGGASSSEEIAQIWEAAKAPETKTVTETSAAAMGRRDVADWVASAKKDAEDKQYKKHPLELKKEREMRGQHRERPGEGHMVLLGREGGIGQIVAVDDESGQVIVRNKMGDEKVFKMSQMHGPKYIPHPKKPGEELQAWKLGVE